MGWDGMGLVDSEQLDYKSTARAVLINIKGILVENLSKNRKLKT